MRIVYFWRFIQSPLIPCFKYSTYSIKVVCASKESNEVIVQWFHYSSAAWDTKNKKIQKSYKINGYIIQQSHLLRIISDMKGNYISYAQG